MQATAHGIQEHSIKDKQAKAIDIYFQMATMLQQIQDAKCVFTDMKNENWLMDEKGKLKIADTKSFMAIDNQGQMNQTLTDNKWLGIIWSPHMNAPEFIKGSFSADKMHVYLLGRALLFFLTNRYTYDPIERSFFKIPLFNYNKGPSLKELIEKMTKEEPEERISLSEAKYALTKLYSGYSHADMNKSRQHKFLASTNLEAYSTFKGDALKTRILLKAKEQLRECKSEEDITRFKDAFRTEIDILKKGQGRTTQFFHLNTSSWTAFKEMVQARQDEIEIERNPARARLS